MNFELLISEIPFNPPNLWCSFSVICMPSQSSTETSRVIVSFLRDVIVERDSIPDYYFFSARNELSDVKSCSCVNICWVKIPLRGGDITSREVRDTCYVYWCDSNNVASFVVVSQRFLHHLVSTCNERLCQFTHGIFSAFLILGISRKPLGPWSVQPWPSHYLCNP